MNTEKSVGWVTASAMFVIALFGWGFLAGSYTGATSRRISQMSVEELSNIERRGLVQARRDGKLYFVANAIKQLPNFATVMSWHFSNRVWLPITILGLEILAAGGGYAMKRVERELSKPLHRTR